MTIPDSQVPDLVALHAQGYIDFFQIDLLGGGSIFIKSGPDVSWNNENWTGTTVQLSGVGVHGDDQVSRPKLAFINPDAVFSPFVASGIMNRALISRYRVLVPDVAANNPYYILQKWIVNRPASVTRLQISLELRTLMDVPNYQIPNNTFSPPVFPTVTIS